MARRTLGLVDWAAIAAASAMPLVVAAQTAEPEVYSLDGSVTVEQAVDDNIYGTANNRESDFITRVMPRLEAKMETEALTARAIANAEYGRFASHDDEDYLDAEIGADATLRFVDGLSAFAGIEHAWDHEDRDSPDDVQGVSPTEYRRLGGWAGFEAVVGANTARVGINVNQFDFDDVDGTSGTIDNDYRDRVMTESGARVTHALSDDRRVFVQGAYDRREYDAPGAFDRDSDGVGFAVGLDGDYGALTGEVLVGFLMQDYADPALDDVTTFDVGAALTWTPAPLTRLRLSLDRTIEETTVFQNGVPASSYTATAFRARAAHRVSPQVSIGADIAWQMDEYNGIDRTDHIGAFGVDARYYMTPHVWLGAGLRHIERNSNVGGADYAANVAMIRIGAQSAAEYAKTALPGAVGRSEFYVGADVGHASMVTTLDGPRGSTGTNQASFGEDGFAGGLFVGWRRQVNDARFGIEAGAELADVEWIHNGDRTFSVKRSDLYSLSAIAGLDLSGGSFAYMRGGVVSANVETNYAEGVNSFSSEDREIGARLGVGIEAPVTAGLSARMEYVVTAWEDHNAGVGGTLDNFADAEGMARLGLIWRFGADAEIPESEPVDFGGFYAGALLGHGALMSGNTGDRNTFTLDADRAGFGAGFGVVAGYGRTFDNVYVGGEVDAEISSLNWTQERSPTGRVYSVEKTHTLGASLRLGYVVNDGLLVYARGGPVVSGFDTDYATTGASASSSEDKVGLRVGAGVEVGMSENLRLRLDYTHTAYDDFGISYGGTGRDEFENSENQFRVGVLYSF